MKKYDITIIGQFHTNHNEDGLFSSEIGKNKLLLAVMDGCSAAIESDDLTIIRVIDNPIN